MPFRNVYAVSIRNSKDFKEIPGQKGKFRTKKITDGISVLIGRLARPPKGQENSGVVKSYRFNVSRFKTKAQVTNWLKKNKVKYKSIEEPTKTNEELNEAATEKEKEAQKARSRKYGISIKSAGHITKPKSIW